MQELKYLYCHYATECRFLLGVLYGASQGARMGDLDRDLSLKTWSTR